MRHNKKQTKRIKEISAISSKIIKKNPILIISIAMIFLISILFWEGLFSLLMISLIFFFGCISRIYKRFAPFFFDLEFITIPVILFAYEIGIIFALVSGFLMLIISSFLEGKVNFPAILAQMFIYFVISIIVVIFSGIGFTELAITMVILRNVMLFPIGFFVLGRDPFQLLLVTSTNVLFNLILLNWLGDFLVRLL